MRFSIIIAAYNEEKNIRSCVERIAQEFILDSEVIIVDDGSQDNTLDICHQLEAEYDFVKVFHQANSGVAIARNTGILKSSGEWITFVDADDLVFCAGLEHLIDLSVQTGANIGIGVQVSYDQYCEPQLEYHVYQGKELIKYLLNKKK